MFRRNADEAGPGIEARICGPEIGLRSLAVSRPVHRQVVENDRVAVGSQHDVDLDGRRAPILGRLQGQRVFSR